MKTINELSNVELIRLAREIGIVVRLNTLIKVISTSKKTQQKLNKIYKNDVCVEFENEAKVAFNSIVSMKVFEFSNISYENIDINTIKNLEIKISKRKSQKLVNICDSISNLHSIITIAAIYSEVNHEEFSNYHLEINIYLKHIFFTEGLSDLALLLPEYSSDITKCAVYSQIYNMLEDKFANEAPFLGFSNN